MLCDKALTLWPYCPGGIEGLQLNANEIAGNSVANRYEKKIDVSAWNRNFTNYVQLIARFVLRQ